MAEQTCPVVSEAELAEYAAMCVREDEINAGDIFPTISWHLYQGCDICEPRFIQLVSIFIKEANGQ